MRFLPWLVVTLHVMSCVPPTCYPEVFGTQWQNKHFVTVRVYSDPIEEPLKRTSEMRVGMWERFKREASIDIDNKGHATVFAWSDLPSSCPRISQDELAEVSRLWKPTLDHLVLPQTVFWFIANPYTGDDWRADGPHLEISYGALSEKGIQIMLGGLSYPPEEIDISERTFHLMWDGQSCLPEEIDTAVIATLEMVCSNSWLAKKYLLRDLPQQLVSRLKCSTD